jgi:RIO kinase 1
MWSLHEQNLLTPDTRLRGDFRVAERVANTASVLELIGDANRDERKRRDALGLRGGPSQPSRGGAPKKDAPVYQGLKDEGLKFFRHLADKPRGGGGPPRHGQQAQGQRPQGQGQRPQRPQAQQHSQGQQRPQAQGQRPQGQQHSQGQRPQGQSSHGQRSRPQGRRPQAQHPQVEQRRPPPSPAPAQPAPAVQGPDRASEAPRPHRAERSDTTPNE